MKTVLYGFLATALLLTFAQTAVAADPGDVIMVPIDGPTLDTTLPDIKPLPLPPEEPKAEPAKVAQPQDNSKSWSKGKDETSR